MKFHAPSFVIGVVTAVAYQATRKRLRPVVVEITSLGVHMARIARAMLERQREDLEDLWAEVEARVNGRVRGVAREKPPEPRPSAVAPTAPSMKAV